MPSLVRLIWEGPRLRLALFIGRALAWDAPWIPSGVVGLFASSAWNRGRPANCAFYGEPWLASWARFGRALDCLLDAPWLAPWIALGPRGRRGGPQAWGLFVAFGTFPNVVGFPSWLRRIKGALTAPSLARLIWEGPWIASWARFGGGPSLQTVPRIEAPC